MRKEEFEELNSQKARSLVIDLNEIGGRDRTLLYGYTVERHHWHVYLRDGMIHQMEVKTSLEGNPTNYAFSGSIMADSVVPDKRVYPESTDFHFARLLVDRGISIPFTMFREDRYEHLRGYVFHGPVWEHSLGPVWRRENGVERIWKKDLH